MTFVSGPMQCDASPTSAMRPSAIATSMPSWISAVQTLTRRAFLMTVSAFCTPMATRAIVRVTSYSGFLQNLFSILFPPSSLRPIKRPVDRVQGSDTSTVPQSIPDCNAPAGKAAAEPAKKLQIE